MRRCGAAAPAALLRFSVVCAVCALCGCGPQATPVVTPPPPGPSPEQKLAWILELEDQRMVRGPAEGQDLVTMLGDPLAHIRRRAAQATGRARAAEAVPGLSAMLANETDPEVRQMAAFALGQIGSPDGADALRASLASPDPLLQGRAAEALGMLGDKAAAPAIAAMMKPHVDAGVLAAIAPDDVGYPKDATVEAVRLGLYALVRLASYDELAATLLDGSGSVRSRWWPVAYAFQRVGNPKAAPVLAALLQGEGQITRAFAARGLGTLKHAPAIPALSAIAGDPAQPQAVRVQAIRALAAIGDHAAAAPLVKVVAAPKIDATLQVEAVAALGQLRGAAGVDVLLDTASAPWPTLRAASLVALGRIDPDVFVSVIAGLDPDPHWSVRAALAGALGQLPDRRG
jgi:HEAT repeat protein